MKDLSKYLKTEKKGLTGLKAKILQSEETEVVASRPVQPYKPVSEWVRERHDSDSEEDQVPLDQDGDLDVPIKPPTVVRDSHGRQIADPSSYQSPEELARAANEAALAKWSGGLVQAAQKRSLSARLLEESKKPFSRYEIDTEADQELRQKDRFGDPLSLFRSSAETKAASEPLYSAANRFNIQPGKRWDGVDRSNGFEVKYLSALAARKAQAPEAYREANLDL